MANDIKSETSSGNERDWLRTTEYIYLKPGEYPQPLTFTLSGYSDVIEHPVEVPIIENGEPVDPLRSTVLAELPVPEGARQTEILTGSSNSNIRIGVRYEKENIGGELGLYPPQEYFQMLQEAGWTEDEDKRMGHVHFFSKDKAQITIRVGEDELRVYEMLEESP